MAKLTDNNLRRIDNVLMAISIDPHDQTEGVVAVPDSKGILMPLIAADPGREPFVREWAKKAAEFYKIPVKLCRLTGRVDISLIAPDGTETSLS